MYIREHFSDTVNKGSKLTYLVNKLKHRRKKRPSYIEALFVQGLILSSAEARLEERLLRSEDVVKKRVAFPLRVYHRLRDIVLPNAVQKRNRGIKSIYTFRTSCLAKGTSSHIFRRT